jgi:hypothetical protein
MPSIDIEAVRALNERIDADENFRSRFARDYTAGGVQEITDRNWRGYWCAQTTVDFGAYRDCIASGSAGQVRRRWLVLLAAVIAALIALVSLAIQLFLIRRRRRKNSLP